MRLRLPVVLLLLLAAVVVAVGSVAYARHRHQLPRSPVLATAPTRAPSFVTRRIDGGKVCEGSYGLADRSAGPPITGRLWVDPHPIGGVALWLPGLNSRCRSVLTRLDAEQAQTFAKAVEHAPALRSGTFNCPADDASAVTVFLTYPRQPKAEVVTIYLSGCRGMSVPGREGRQPGGALSALGPEPAGLH